jgi:hypothetical protein
MKNWYRLVLCLIPVLAAPAHGQANSPEVKVAVPILQRASLPMYPPIAKAAHVTGKVIVRVTVKNGQIFKTDVLSQHDAVSGQRLLELPTIANLKTWRFASSVNATFTVNYTYEISGEETIDPTNAKVEILPSLDVTILSRPAKPTCSDCRSNSLPPSSAGQKEFENMK